MVGRDAGNQVRRRARNIGNKVVLLHNDVCLLIDSATLLVKLLASYRTVVIGSDGITDESRIDLLYKRGC